MCAGWPAALLNRCEILQQKMHMHRLARGFDGQVGSRRLKSALFNGY
jgi:hypothetical protein